MPKSSDIMRTLSSSGESIIARNDLTPRQRWDMLSDEDKRTLEDAAKLGAEEIERIKGAVEQSLKKETK